MGTQRVRLGVGTMSVVAALMAPGLAVAAFSPSIKFSLSTRKAGANPQVGVRIAQDAGEVPIDKVTFLFPRGFRFPRDHAIADQEKLGRGQFTTATAPFCNAGFQPSFPSTAHERDRTPEEVKQGVWSVWVVDLGVVKVDLVFRRTAAGAWRAVADVPNSALVCPPAALVATLYKTSAESRTKIWQNPRRPGKYTLTSILQSTTGSRYIIRQRIKFAR